MIQFNLLRIIISWLHVLHLKEVYFSYDWYVTQVLAEFFALFWKT